MPGLLRAQGWIRCHPDVPFSSNYPVIFFIQMSRGEGITVVVIHGRKINGIKLIPVEEKCSNKEEVWKGGTDRISCLLCHRLCKL